MAARDVFFKVTADSDVGNSANWYTDRACTAGVGAIPDESNDTAYFELPTTALTGTLPACANVYVNMTGWFNAVVLGAVSGTVRFDVTHDQTFSCSSTIAILHVKESGSGVVTMTSGTATTKLVGAGARLVYGASAAASTTTVSYGVYEEPESSNAGGVIKIFSGRADIGRSTATSLDISGGTAKTIGSAKTHALVRVFNAGVWDMQSGGAVSNYEIAAGAKATAINSPYANVAVGGAASYEGDGAFAFDDGNVTKSASVLKIGSKGS